MEQQVNRRRWQRYPFDASVRLVVDHSPVDRSSVEHSPVDRTADRTIVNARGVRFSEGGICLFAAANLPVGSQVRVEFNTPHSEEPVRVCGKVRNRSVYLYGVEFLSNKFEDRQQLARLSAQFRSGSRPSAW